MPDTPKPLVNPSPSWMQKLMGGAMSGRTAQNWPELERAWASRQINMPNETAATSRVTNMGPLFRTMNPDAYAVTGPMGNIALNRGLIEKDGQNIDDVLTHELTHVGQGKGGFLRQLYGDSKVETDAIDAEAMRKTIRNDINLPTMKPKLPTKPLLRK